jgi:hypothetical protein
MLSLRVEQTWCSRGIISVSDYGPAALRYTEGSIKGPGGPAAISISRT